MASTTAIDVSKVLGTGWAIDYGPELITTKNQGSWESPLAPSCALQKTAVKQTGDVQGMAMYAPPVGWRAALASKKSGDGQSLSDVVWISPTGTIWSINACTNWTGSGSIAVVGTKKSSGWSALVLLGLAGIGLYLALRK